MNYIQNSDKVLLIWNNSSPENLTNFVNDVKSKTGTNNVLLENSQIITMSEYKFKYINIDIIDIEIKV